MAAAKGVVLFSVVMFTSFSKGAVDPVVMTCPLRLMEGEVNNVTCKINTTAIANAGCFSSPSNVLFQIKGQVNPLCTSQYISSCSTRPDTIAEGGCDCTEQTGNVKTYIFKFEGTANEYEGKNLECTVCAASPEISIPESNCASLKYAESCPECDQGKCQRDSGGLRTTSCKCDSTHIGVKCSHSKLAIGLGVFFGAAAPIAAVVVSLLWLKKCCCFANR